MLDLQDQARLLASHQPTTCPDRVGTTTVFSQTLRLTSFPARLLGRLTFIKLSCINRDRHLGEGPVTQQDSMKKPDVSLHPASSVY